MGTCNGGYGCGTIFNLHPPAHTCGSISLPVARDGAVPLPIALNHMSVGKLTVHSPTLRTQALTGVDS